MTRHWEISASKGDAGRRLNPFPESESKDVARRMSPAWAGSDPRAPNSHSERQFRFSMECPAFHPSVHDEVFMHRGLDQGSTSGSPARQLRGPVVALCLVVSCTALGTPY